MVNPIQFFFVMYDRTRENNINKDEMRAKNKCNRGRGRDTHAFFLRVVLHVVLSIPYLASVDTNIALFTEDHHYVVGRK